MPRIHFLEFSLFLSRRDARIKHFSVPNKTVFGNACRLKTASSASLLFPHIGISAKFCSQAGYPVSLQKWRSMALHLPAFTHTHTHAWTTRTVNNGARLVSGHAIQQLLCVCVWVEERERWGGRREEEAAITLIRTGLPWRARQETQGRLVPGHLY